MATPQQTQPAAETNVQEMMLLMDVVDALRRQDGEVHHELSHADRQKDLKDRLRRTYESMGIVVDDAMLERAIRDHESRLYEFREPVKDLRYKLARMYVDRGRIGRRYGIPGLVLTALLGLGVGIYKIGKAIHLSKEESRVEQLVEKAYRDRIALGRDVENLKALPLPAELRKGIPDTISRTGRHFQEVDTVLTAYVKKGSVEEGITTDNYGMVEAQMKPVTAAIEDVGREVTGFKQESERHRTYEAGIETSIDSGFRKRQALDQRAAYLLTSPLFADMPEQDRKTIEVIVQRARESFGRVNAFFETFAPKGAAQEAVTIDNYASAEAAYDAVSAVLNTTQTEVVQGENLLKNQQALKEIQKTLDVLIGEIRQTALPAPLRQAAERRYTEGRQGVQYRNASAAAAYVKELETIRTDGKEYSRLTEYIERVHEGIKKEARTDDARAEEAQLYQEAEELKQLANVDRLQAVAKKFDDLAGRLRQTYRLRIVDEPDVRSGIDRYYTDERGRRASGHYLIVEAVGAHGRAVAMNIRNEENGRTERVTRWGERVPESVYERVKADKMPDGRIDDGIIGVKNRGTLTPEYKASFKLQGGQITQW